LSVRFRHLLGMSKEDCFNPIPNIRPEIFIIRIHILHPKWFIPRAFHSFPRSLQVSNELLPFVAAGRHVLPFMHLYPQRCRFDGITVNVWLRTQTSGNARRRDTISSRRVKADSPNCWLRCVIPEAYTHTHTHTREREGPPTIMLELSQYLGEKEDSAESCHLYMEMCAFSPLTALPSPIFVTPSIADGRNRNVKFFDPSRDVSIFLPCPKHALGKNRMSHNQSISNIGFVPLRSKFRDLEIQVKSSELRAKEGG